MAGGGGNGLGDNGPAIQASLSLPTGIAVDKSGNLYVVDAGKWAHPDGQREHGYHINLCGNRYCGLQWRRRASG